jgi:TrpR family trp operon transcriptional repressor
MFRQIETQRSSFNYIGDRAKSSSFSLGRRTEGTGILPLTQKVIPMNVVTRELIEIFVRTNDRKDMTVLFREIFTPSEIETLTLRWQLLKDLYEGKPQRKIAADHKISLCKITRGSKLLKTKGSYLKKVLDDLYGIIKDD